MYKFESKLDCNDCHDTVKEEFEVPSMDVEASIELISTESDRDGSTQVKKSAKKPLKKPSGKLQVFRTNKTCNFPEGFLLTKKPASCLHIFVRNTCTFPEGFLLTKKPASCLHIFVRNTCTFSEGFSLTFQMEKKPACFYSK
ncbi:hypothetical protein AVEN_249804-1 [Araneus ventricosus]|uniref:Uncharacterized protein n=1 Tax=Araneus ventricosus TaxID=182803 RepID=A0A4Y2W1W3_ARAVE|nr:hypothetical protein AVEN_249804-1 [Araneus ventricosus]